MSTRDLIDLFHHRWAAPALALLDERGGARFVELQRRLGVGGDSLRRALDTLESRVHARRNTVYGHAVPPEYAPRPRGRDAARVARQVLAAGPADTLLRKW